MDFDDDDDDITPEFLASRKLPSLDEEPEELEYEAENKPTSPCNIELVLCLVVVNTKY